MLAGEWKGQRMDYIGEWIQSKFRIPKAEYEQLAAQFNPQAFDADEWVRLAKRAGMRYVVFTSKHHEGFAMYRSACDPYNIVDATPFGRDPLRELAEACQRHGVRLGLYYSQDLDWHELHGGDPGRDDPQGTNAGGMSWGNDWDFPERSAKNYALYFEKKVKPQVRELLTQYGPIALMWFDCPLTISREQSLELWDLVRELQPACLVNTRLGHHLGDYGSMGDNQVPSGHVQGIWETPATLNDTWGFKYFDHNWKSAADTLSVLAGLASKNVNYLLNIGPQPDGRLPDASVGILRELGDWMDRYGDAIHGTRRNPFPYGFDWGWMTQRAGTSTEPAKVYLFFKKWPTSPFHLHGLRNRGHAAYEMTSPRQPIPIAQAVAADQDELTLNLPAQRPATMIPVVVLELAGEPEADQRLLGQDGDSLLLPAGCGQVQGGETGTTQPRLAHTGILMDWLDRRSWVEWEVYIPAAGDYQVDIITSAVHHSNPWKGGHRVRLETADAALEAVLQMDEAVTLPETRYHAQAVSHCGKLAFQRSGRYSLALRALAIQPNGGVGLALVAIRLWFVRRST